MSGWESDLVVLVADKNMEAGVRGLLSRWQALGLREVRHEVHVHVERDPGCFHRGHDFLRPMAGRYAHSLILFDREGSGQEQQTRESLEKLVTRQLASAGWGDRAKAIVIDPELEVWVWSDSPHVARLLGWEGGRPNLRRWLADERMWLKGRNKPEDPKRAVERALRRARKPRSSALFRGLAENVSLRSCTDPAFLKFRQTLAEWFPEANDS